MSNTLSTSVVITGGGPVGLAMGLLLHRRQIDCVVIEQTRGTTDNPTSRGVGAEAPYMSSRQITESMKSEQEAWKGLIERLHIRLE